MNEVSIIINGVRYDAVDNTDPNIECAFYEKTIGCDDCVIGGMELCEKLIGMRIFIKSNKMFEV